MFVIYNYNTKKYICRASNGTFLTTEYKANATIFPDFEKADNIIKNNNIPSFVKDRENFAVCVYEEEKDKSKSALSLDNIEAIVKENDKKIKTINTFLKNIYSSISNFSTARSMIDEKVNLIYHYIESGLAETPEDKIKINDLLNRTLRVRREIKKYCTVAQCIEDNGILSSVNKLEGKIAPFAYRKYEMDDFIEMIEGGNDEPKRIEL